MVSRALAAVCLSGVKGRKFVRQSEMYDAVARLPMWMMNTTARMKTMKTLRSMVVDRIRNLR